MNNLINRMQKVKTFEQIYTIFVACDGVRNVNNEHKLYKHQFCVVI